VGTEDQLAADILKNPLYKERFEKLLLAMDVRKMEF